MPLFRLIRVSKAENKNIRTLLNYSVKTQTTSEADYWGYAKMKLIIGGER